jgi:2-keto-4-pentenoate hydratase/2-oxohepta-3-ene-1,7-dioic acid hydratase in catechol pathway
MKYANLNGRAALLNSTTALDVAEASDGKFSSDPMVAFADWEAFRAWADTADFSAAKPYDPADLRAPVASPRQVLAIGLNYKDHALESGIDIPENPVVFTKFQSSLTGPVTEVKVPGDTMDYESELVIIIGKTLHKVDEQTALDGVAGYAVGQDFSERTVQQRPPAAQFGLGKSFPGFGPFGPAVVTPDEVGDDAGNLRVKCVITGPTAEAQGVEAWTAQDGNTEDMIFPVAELVAHLANILTLYPGDIIFTGTPKGIGQPQGIFLQPGDVVTTSIEGLGQLENTMV